jgi:electron transfer flavoprotein alpha subunit
MTTLLLAEHDHATLKDVTNKALTAATQLGGEVHVLVAGGGEGTRAAAEAAAKLAGVKKVLLAEGDAYAHDLAEPLAALIVALAPSYDAFVAPATSRFKNVMPRVAALLDVMQVSEIIKVVSPDTFERPIYAGNAIQTVKSKDAKKVITVRTSTFAATGDGGSAPVENAASAADPGLSSFVGEEVAKSDRPELTSAKIIVSGGRAMQSRENFAKYIEPLADKLGAGVGASRAAVDAGYAPNDWQGGCAGTLCRDRHLRCDPASRRHEGFQGDRRDQQGRGRADFPGRRLRPGRGSLSGGSRADRGARQAWKVTMVEGLAG